MPDPEIIAGKDAVLLWRSRLPAAASLGFVPTMGALHEGHASLVRAAREANDIVAVSVYVNPSQFSEGEDFSAYPRTLERDAELAGRSGADAVLTFADSQMYPPSFSTWVEVEGLSKGLCGASRPGHFRGVATVVAKLFNIVRPARAYFGQKDAQQTAVIRRLVRDLDFGIEIIVMPTVREPDGLAMSSRNRYLSPAERERALCLRTALLRAQGMVGDGETSVRVILAAMRDVIRSVGGDIASVDYVEIVDPADFTRVDEVDRRALAVLAVRIGKARLIDNDFLDPPRTDHRGQVGG